MKILFEDNHLLIVDKPVGMISQSIGTEEASVETWAKEYLKAKYNKPGNVFAHATHRLDRPVGGILLLARTSKALSRLQEAQRERNYQKIYHATVEGLIRNERGELTHYLIHGDHRAIVSRKDVPDAKEARLSYRVLERADKTTKVEITLHTGRYHQIRAQFAAVGHPIVGDSRYGAKMTCKAGISLRHVSLTMVHPVTGETLSLQAY